ncbi:MAG: amidohydrolase family protein [Thermoplasmata archaeon]
MSLLEIGGRIFDGAVDQVEPGVVVVDTETGRIVETRSTATTDASARSDPTTIVTTGTILPGFVDAHLHLFGARKADLVEWTVDSPVRSALRAVPDLRHLLESGFTAVRDLGSKSGPLLRQAVDEGDLPGPRIVTSGRSLAETGGDDDVQILPPDISARLAYSIFCDGPWECRKAVRQVVRDGANVIKVYASGSFMQGTKVRPQLSEEEIGAIVTEAHKMGIRVAAHAYGEEPIRTAVEAGADSIEHGIGLTEDLCELMKRKGTYYVPTLSVYAGWRSLATGTRREMLERHFTKDIGLALQSELRIVAGTDGLGVDPLRHGQNASEMIQLVGAGLTPLQALRAGTASGAACLDLPFTGSLRAGAVADIVVVSGTPDRDIELVGAGHVEHVLLGGHVVK